MKRKKNIVFLSAIFNAELSQAGLSARTGISRQTICRLVNGRAATTKTTAGKLARALGLPVEALGIEVIR